MTINEDIYTSIYICTCIHIINTDLSTCRLVDLSTCRPVDLVLFVNNKDPVRVRVSVWLGLGLG